MKFTMRSTQEKVFIVLVVVVLVLGSLNVVKAKGLLIPEQPGIMIEEGVVELDSLTLEQKIAQMVIVHGGLHNREAWKKMQLGGIHQFALASPQLFKDIVGSFQEDMEIPFFVTADLEGCLNPFAAFHNSTFISEISSVEQAFEKGKQEGAFLRSLGFTLNFAPVVDLDDHIWDCRSFPGGPAEVGELAGAYVNGLQSQGVIATAKHYPGKTLVILDPHKELVVAEIGEDDLHPYEYLVQETDVASIMVSHLIVFGALDSSGVPSVVSGEVIGNLREEYGGLIITDDTMMLGLRKFFDTADELYVAVFQAGADLVINFDEDPEEIYRMIQVVASAVESGEISQEAIDNSVRRILEAKGFIVV